MNSRDIIEGVYECITETLGKTRDIIDIYGCDNDDWCVNFQVKGAEHWLFAIWVNDLENGCIKESERRPAYEVNLFGQALRSMDKFKPSHSPIAYEFEVPKDRANLYMPDGGYKWWLDEVEKFAMDIHKVYKSHIGAMIKYYWEPEYGTPAVWLMERWLEYCVEKPLRERFGCRMEYLYLRCKKVVHWVFLWPWLVDVVVSDNNRNGYVRYPRFDFIDVMKPGLSENTLCRLYHLTTPLHGFNGVNYGITVKDEKRSFWFPSETWEEYRKLREKCVYGLVGLGRKQRLARRFEYIVKYPGLWFKWKFGSLS